MFPIGEKKKAMQRIEAIFHEVEDHYAKGGKHHDAFDLMKEYHQLAKKYDLYTWAMALWES